jgi:hypothetical protein
MITKLGISFFISILLAFTAYFFTQQSTLTVKNSDIIYVKKSPIAPGIIDLSRAPGEEFSFFINVYIIQKQGQRGSFIILQDRFNKISFLIRPDGIPCVLWQSKKLLPSRKARQSITSDGKVSPNQWNHVGFIYKKDKLSTFVNGHKCWEILINDKKFSLSHLEFLPETNNASTGEKSLPGKATYPILLGRVLSPQHILDLYKESQFYGALMIKIFSLFLFSFLFFYFALTGLFLLFISRGGPGFAVVYQVWRNVLFVFSLHFIFFLVFNLGYRAAGHINLYFSSHGLWNPSPYFIFLVATGFVFLFSLALQKITRSPARICFIYGSGVLSLLIFTFILCLIPRFTHIYPLVFNGLFSLLFSLMVVAPNILWMLGTTRADHETE